MTNNDSANPQLEDGFTQIANELVEAVYNTNLSPYESRILWFIIRMTYGWKQKTDTIALSQFEDGIKDKKTGAFIIKGTNINHRHVCSTLNSLYDRRIITKNRNGYITEYGLQKDYTKWINKIRQGSAQQGTAQQGTADLGSSVNPTSTLDPTSKRNPTTPD